MTCGDSNYYKFLKIFEDNIFQIYNSYPEIYDLGMTSNQLASLRSNISNTSTDNKFNKKNSKDCIYTTHKPYCILDFLSKNENNCLYLDADMLSTDKIKNTIFSNIDIAVTPRHKKELKPSHLKNGLLNAGFLYFKNSNPVKEFINQWIKSCTDSDYTDQEALSLILSKNIDLFNGPPIQKFGELSVALLDPLEYNDVSCSTGRIFHFKNAGRKKEAWDKYEIFAASLRKYPKFTLTKTFILRNITNFFLKKTMQKRNYHK
jgi:hypothetical protein